MPTHSVVRVQKKTLRLDDEMQFIRSWIEKPLSTGAVMPSSKALARTMARYVDPKASGPVIELGPAIRPVHLCHGAADPEDAVRDQGRGLRADLAQPAARARVGLSRALNAFHKISMRLMDAPVFAGHD